MATETPWTTNRPTGDDTPGVEQQNLTPDSIPGAGDGDRVLVSHVHVLRDKVAYLDTKIENSTTLPTGTLGSHKSRHENGGDDEISVAGLSGELADPQPPKTHTHTASDVTDFDTEVGNHADVSANTSARHSHANKTDLDAIPQSKYDATTAPTVNDDNTAGYGVGSRWFDVSADKEYACLDAATGAAVWTETTQSGGSASPLTTKGDLYGYDTGNARIGVGSDDQVLVADSSAGVGVAWKSGVDYIDTDAFHQSLRQEISGLTDQVSLNANDLFVVEAYSEVVGEEWRKRKIAASAVQNDPDAFHDDVAGEINSLTEKSSPVGTDLLVIEDSADSNNKKKVQLTNLPGGGSGSLDRHLVFSDDVEFTETDDVAYHTKKTFRIIRDSAKKPSSWRLVVSLWVTGGTGESADCRLQVGGTDNNTVSSTETSETASSIKKIALTVVEGNEAEDTFLTVNIDLKISDDTGGAVAHMKYTDLYAIYT
jgi:hypothetical protein